MKIQEIIARIQEELNCHITDYPYVIWKAYLFRDLHNLSWMFGNGELGGQFSEEIDAFVSQSLNEISSKIIEEQWDAFNLIIDELGIMAINRWQKRAHDAQKKNEELRAEAVKACQERQALKGQNATADGSSVPEEIVKQDVPTKKSYLEVLKTVISEERKNTSRLHRLAGKSDRQTDDSVRDQCLEISGDSVTSQERDCSTDQKQKAGDEASFRPSAETEKKDADEGARSIIEQRANSGSSDITSLSQEQECRRKILSQILREKRGDETVINKFDEKTESTEEQGKLDVSPSHPPQEEGNSSQVANDGVIYVLPSGHGLISSGKTQRTDDSKNKSGQEKQRRILGQSGGISRRTRSNAGKKEEGQRRGNRANRLSQQLSIVSAVNQVGFYHRVPRAIQRSLDAVFCFKWSKYLNTPEMAFMLFFGVAISILIISFFPEKGKNSQDELLRSFRKP